ncbi:unnamed protein product [Rhizophagus irregularis]|uniref:Uncharacterized protein n=1 Tax=Rhizophagus irregularis TaxID=588596 RepID=A0A2I1GPU3_9GLOM|nr:hypothetical protein RhiirA4_464289 [Rhizophagus irregularis]CAB4440418.1 unnamed protein product [Rhizophagus irregularis]
MEICRRNYIQLAVFSRKTSEYPKTAEAGVATVFNITGWTNPRDCWNNNPSVDLSKTESITNKKSKGKEKKGSKTDKKHQKVNDNNYLNLNYHENDSIEFEEQQIALREKKLSKDAFVKNAVVEAEALKLANLVKKKELGLYCRQEIL